MYAKTNKQLTLYFGEFGYLPATLCSFPERLASQNSTQRKDNKVGNKTCCKKGRQKEKREEFEERILKTDASLPPKKDKLCLEVVKRQKKLLNYIQLAEKYALSARNLFFSHSHVNQPKTASKRRIWSKMLFFFFTKWSY